MRTKNNTTRMFSRIKGHFYQMVEKMVVKYLDNLPDERFVKLAPRIMGAAGLTETQYKRLVESVKGDVFVEIYFANGDTATISTRGVSGRTGPGW